MRLRRKQHATVLFMVFHVSLGTILVAQPWPLAPSKEGSNTFSTPLLSRTSLSLSPFLLRFYFNSCPLPPPSSQSWTQSYVVSEGSQAGNNWLKVTSSGLRGRLGLHLPPSASHFLPLLLGSSCCVPGPHEWRLCWVSWQPGSIGFGYQSESILKDDCLRAVSHGQAQSEGLRGALELECSLMEGLENEEGGEERKIRGRRWSYCCAKECPWRR